MSRIPEIKIIPQTALDVSQNFPTDQAGSKGNRAFSQSALSSSNNTSLVLNPFYFILGTVRKFLNILSLGFLFREEEKHTTQRKERSYADIEGKPLALKVLQDENVEEEKKREVALQVANDPGSFHPPCLFFAGLYFLKASEVERGAKLCLFGIYRSQIDFRLTNDLSLACVSNSLSGLAKVMSEKYLSKEKLEEWKAHFKKASENFVEWDQRTPRNYDEAWIRLNSVRIFTKEKFKERSSEEKARIIKGFYQVVKNLNSSNPFANISVEDEYHFDPMSRKVTLKDWNISFDLPEACSPFLDEWGKMIGFTDPGGVEVDTVLSWSKIENNFTTKYVNASKNLKSRESIHFMSVPNTNHEIGAYMIKKPSGGSVFWDKMKFKVVVVNKNHTHTFHFECKYGERDEFEAEIVNPLFGSLKFLDEIK